MGQNLNARVVKFIAASSVYGKRTSDSLRSYQLKEAAATPRIAPTLTLLQRQGLVPVEFAKEASDLLSTHAGTLELLQSVTEKLAEAQASGRQKAAGELGRGYDPEPKKTTTPVFNSLTSPFIGRVTGEKKASDLELDAVLLPPPGR